MLRWRLLSAAVLISIALALAWLDYKQVLGAPPGAWMIPLYLTILGLGTHEMLTLFANNGWHPARPPLYVGVLAISCAACEPILKCLLKGKWLQDFDLISAFLPELIRGFIRLLRSGIIDNSNITHLISPHLGTAILFMIIFLAEIRRFKDADQHLINVALSIFTVIYIGVLGSYFAELRFMAENHFLGMFALLSMIIIVKASDAGAYAIGRILGKTRLAPTLSPGKTYEGAFGGVLTAGIVSVVLFQLVAPSMIPHWKSIDPATYVCYGILLGSVGIVGDLAESMLKREMGVKDSGNTLPGIGGVLDVLDSLLFAAPVAYVCWELGLLGQ